MPLHLLGKKSWNVYNPANIARVRRDEAAAQAREEAEEQRMQEEDAARRLAILRGEAPPPLEEPQQPNEALPPPPQDRERDAYRSAISGRKRKRHGEDDTDFEMRIARERAAAGDRAGRELATHTATTTSAPLLDSKGHITLFPEPDPHSTAARSREGHPEATREAARKERELKDQYQMRLVNAAGRDGQGLTDGGPWYASADAGAGGEAGALVVPSKNVFGREDPGRGARAVARLDASDPLAVMRQGAKRVRELERERRKEVGERERELRALEKEERREERRRERKRRREGDERSRREEEGDGHSGKTERHASSGGDRGSGRGERRSRHDDEFGEKDNHRNDERERRGRDERDSSRKRERSSRGHEDKARDRSREPDRRREVRHKNTRHRDDDKTRRPYKADNDRDRDSRRTDHR